MTQPFPQAGDTTVLSADTGFCEGPVVLDDGAVAAVAIDRACVTRTSAEGVTTVLARTGGGPNGLVADGRGGFYLCQNGGIWPATQTGQAGVQHIDRDGTVTQIATGMVAPNDLAIGPDGMLYVTDPTRTPERNDGRIWRLNPDTGECGVWMRMGWYCNGIAFGLEDDHVYIADTGGGRIVRVPLTAPDEDHVILAARLRHGLPDGFAFDIEGRIVTGSIGAAEGDAGCVEIHDPKDGFVRRIDCQGSRFVTNVALGPDGRAFITDSGHGRLLSCQTDLPGLPLFPFRR